MTGKEQDPEYAAEADLDDLEISPASAEDVAVSRPTPPPASSPKSPGAVRPAVRSL